MTTIVYWASLEREWMLAKEPEPVAKIFYEKNLHDSKNKNAQLNYCHSFNENLKFFIFIGLIFKLETIVSKLISFEISASI